MGDTITTIIVAMLTSEALLGFIMFIINRHDNKHKEIDRIAEQVDLNRETLATVSYMLLADKLDHRIEKGWASRGHRREVKLLHDNYEKNGWNGDMDDMMERFNALPYDPPESILPKMP